MSEIRREYGSASTTAETPLGPLYVWATSRDHVGISTSDSRDGAGAAAESVTVQRVAYRLRLDLHPAAYYARREASGERVEWQSQPERDELEAFGWSAGRGFRVLTRVDWQNVRDMHGSTSANVKAREALMRWAVEWLATDDGRALLEVAQEQADAAERARLEEERGEVAARLAEIDARLEVLS